MPRAATLEIRPTDFLAFVDETGHESLSDPNHPVFGLGGCAIPACLYTSLIAEPWLALRREFFPGVHGPLHAAELNQPTNAQFAALGAFFGNHAFARVASLVSTASSSTAKARAYEKCSEALLAFLHSLTPASCDRIVVTFESYDKRDLKGSYALNRALRFLGSTREFIPVRVARGVKRDCHPGLEVADFIMHAAGGQVRTQNLPDPRRRKDFHAVFGAVPETLVRFGFLEVAEEDQ